MKLGISLANMLMESSCGGSPGLHQNVETGLHLLAQQWKDKLCGIIYGIDDMEVLCMACGSEYPPFSGQMDKILHN